MRLILFILSALAFTIAGCKKYEANPCQSVTQYLDSFVIKEVVGDTAFTTDTIFRDNFVQFESLLPYDSVRWQIGSDSRIFTAPKFSLSFVKDLLTIPIKFTGYKNPNTLCFPGDNGVYAGEKQLTTVEQLNKSNLTLSPLIGRYKGAFTDAPADTFTVRIEYFDSAKYDVSVTGTKNFYWISNIPKGYVDNTSENANQYPELKHGLPVEMGFKGLLFGWSQSNCNNGKAWLSRDSLYVNYGIVGCRRRFVGKRL